MIAADVARVLAWCRTTEAAARVMYSDPNGGATSAFFVGFALEEFESGRARGDVVDWLRMALWRRLEEVLGAHRPRAPISAATLAEVLRRRP